jgi:hypothetical protein
MTSAEVGSTANTNRPLDRVGHPLRDHAGFGQTVATGWPQAGQHDHLDLGHGFELHGVDDR